MESHKNDPQCTKRVTRGGTAVGLVVTRGGTAVGLAVKRDETVVGLAVTKGGIVVGFDWLCQSVEQRLAWL